MVTLSTLHSVTSISLYRRPQISLKEIQPVVVIKRRVKTKPEPKPVIVEDNVGDEDLLCGPAPYASYSCENSSVTVNGWLNTPVIDDLQLYDEPTQRPPLLRTNTPFEPPITTKPLDFTSGTIYLFENNKPPTIRTDPACINFLDRKWED